MQQRRKPSRSARPISESLEQRRLLSAAISTIASINGTTSQGPIGGLAADSSFNLYGFTNYVGTNTSLPSTIFEVPHGANTVSTLTTISGVNNASPLVFGPPAVDSAGNVYGTTYYPPNEQTNSVIFKLPRGANGISTLAVAPQDVTPQGAELGYRQVAVDGSGNVFAVSLLGGDLSASNLVGWGTISELSAGASQPTTLANFESSNGSSPNSLIIDSQGNLYGTAMFGGDLSAKDEVGYLSGDSGDGVVWELTKNGSSIQVLGVFEGANGAGPVALTLDSTGNLFGTTRYGGANSDGTIFEIPAGTQQITKLADFSSATGTDAQGVIVDGAGNLFGAAYGGGDLTQNSGQGYGTIFELPAGAGTITTLANFEGSNGEGPQGKLIADSSGNLFGETLLGGSSFSGSNSGYGSVFEVTGSGFQALGISPPPAGSDTITLTTPSDQLVFPRKALLITAQLNTTTGAAAKGVRVSFDIVKEDANGNPVGATRVVHAITNAAGVAKINVTEPAGGLFNIVGTATPHGQSSIQSDLLLEAFEPASLKLPTPRIQPLGNHASDEPVFNWTSITGATCEITVNDVTPGAAGIIYTNPNVTTPSLDYAAAAGTPLKPAHTYQVKVQASQDVSLLGETFTLTSHLSVPVRFKVAEQSTDAFAARVDSLISTGKKTLINLTAYTTTDGFGRTVNGPPRLLQLIVPNISGPDVTVTSAFAGFHTALPVAIETLAGPATVTFQASGSSTNGSYLTEADFTIGGSTLSVILTSDAPFTAGTFNGTLHIKPSPLFDKTIWPNE